MICLKQGSWWLPFCVCLAQEGEETPKEKNDGESTKDGMSTGVGSFKHEGREGGSREDEDMGMFSQLIASQIVSESYFWY